MAFPPSPLPINRTNATPQSNTHPSDHNAIGAAVNDTVGVLNQVYKQGATTLSQTGPGGGSLTGGGGTPTLWITPGVITVPTYATRAIVTCSITGAYGSAAPALGTFVAAMQVEGVTGAGFMFQDAGPLVRMPSIVMSGEFVVTTPNAQCAVYVSRASGTNALGADTDTRFAWTAIFLTS